MTPTLKQALREFQASVIEKSSAETPWFEEYPEIHNQCLARVKSIDRGFTRGDELLFGDVAVSRSMSSGFIITLKNSSSDPDMTVGEANNLRRELEAAVKYIINWRMLQK